MQRTFPALSLTSLLFALGCAARHAPASMHAKTTGMNNAALVEAANDLAGTWHCKGAIHGPDGPSDSEVELESALVLGRTWLRTEFRVLAGKVPYGFVSHRTFDAKSGQGLNVLLDTMGGHAVSRSADGKDWTGESHGPAGSMLIRDTDEVVSEDALHIVGKYSRDGGASFATGYDLTCRRAPQEDART